MLLDLQSHGVSSKLTHMLCLSAVLSIENYCVLLDWQLQPHCASHESSCVLLD